MTEQEIINNAPCNDWTGITTEGIYTLIEGQRCHIWLGTCWSVAITNELDIFYDCPIRSRKDIERIVGLEAKNEALKHFKLHILELAKNHNCDSITQLATKCSKQRKRIAELEEKLSFYEDIRSESHGVVGFHLNGDIATWDELEQSE